MLPNNLDEIYQYIEPVIEYYDVVRLIQQYKLQICTHSLQNPVVRAIKDDHS
jgi:hypothetical protein